ncbi:integrase, catalytic region, zinc finger, CCHC-type containing protein [Tanacetum coccineum]
MLFTMPSWKQMNPPYKFKWIEKTIPVAEGSSKTTTEGYMENYKNVSQDIRDQLNAEAEANGFVTLVKQSQELKTVSYHKLYDILKQHQTEVNEIRAERLAPATRNRGKAIINSCTTTYDQEPTLLLIRKELLKDKEIDKLMALISLSFKKIYKPTNNNLRTSSNTSRENQDNTPRINRGTRYDNQRVVNVVGARENVGTPVVHHSGIQCYICKEYRHVARECQKPKRAKDAAYHNEEDAYCLMQRACDLSTDSIKKKKEGRGKKERKEVTPDAADNSGPIFDVEPLQKEQGDNNITLDSLDMCYDRQQDDHDDDDDGLAKEHDLLTSLIEKLKYEINGSKNRNKFLESSNKTLVDKLKGEIEDFKTKNKSLESSNNDFKEANNEPSKTNKLMFKDLKKFQDELEKRHDVTNMSKVELDYAKAKTELMSYKTESQKSINNYSYQINDLNQQIFDMKKELVAHQETISIM